MGKRGNKEGSIYKTKDGKWASSLSLGWEAGRRRRKVFYGGTRAEVQAKLTKALRDVALGIRPPDERLTLERFLLDWLDQVAAKRVRVRTLIGYRHHVVKHINPELGRVPVAKLTPDQVQRLANRKEKELSARSAQYINAVLRAALNHALRTGIVGRNVATLIEAPKVRRKEVAALTPAEAMRILRVVADHRWSAIYIVALTTGMRQGEVLGLEWRDVDLDAATLEVRAQLQRYEGAFHRVPVKTDKSRRKVALPQLAVDALLGRRRKQKEDRLLAGIKWEKASDLVFTSRQGKPINARHVIRTWHKLLDDAVRQEAREKGLVAEAIGEGLKKGLVTEEDLARLRDEAREGRVTKGLVATDLDREIAKAVEIGAEKGRGGEDLKVLIAAALDRYIAESPLPKMRFHDLRHGAATLWLAEGVSLREIMELLGHSQIGITANTYAHVAPELKRAAAKKMDDILGGRR